ncbi:helix-turn-helix domain-containing protein [Sorangium sp. So ce1099]|uniref:helix-turn-helix domain-containing protein n=1 Tax=Sorangium sp. So ce1099 TaxID=3133331 RepID=UPI003F5FCB53
MLDLPAASRRLRQQRGVTQEQLAKAAEIELRTMQAIEVGRQSMSLGTLVRLANALDVPHGVLLRSAEMPEIKRGRPRKRPAGT